MVVKKKVAVAAKGPAKKSSAKNKPVTTKTMKKVPTQKVIIKKPAAKKAVASKKSISTKKPVKKALAPKKVVVKKAAPAKKAVVKKAIVKPTVKKSETKAKVAPKKALPVKTNVTAAPKKKEAEKKGVASKLVKVASEKAADAEMSSANGADDGVLDGGDYMDVAHRAHFRTLLNNWKQQLMTEVDRTVEHMKDDAGNFADPADRATQEEGFSLELRTRDRERKLIKKIEEAVSRLDSDEYGYCEACGVEIGYKRLEARPTATLCIDCKTVDEIREKQIASSS